MTNSVCLCGTENDVTYSLLEENGEYVATVDIHTEIKTETFPRSSTAKKWINRMLDDYCSGKNEIDRII